MIRITDNRTTNKASFKSLTVGEVFEYLESFYIKTGIFDTESNAVDLMRGTDDIVRLDAEVEPLDIEMIVRERECF